MEFISLTGDEGSYRSFGKLDWLYSKRKCFQLTNVSVGWADADAEPSSPVTSNLHVRGSSCSVAQQ